ncbi:Hypp2059 [Branchiostoma lanceolatum]|uniref:Hypp2059 protein n=1 Tax=Branchiostoma lanceolatum TaxID=7740 RepID=A0A8J9ZRD8_BRALA|nr:Hypp2059 [Branchiostoma lanceolatum]
MMSLKNGGADNRYRFSGGDDLRPYNVSASFILQGVHMTLVHHYNDTLNFVLKDSMKPSIKPLGATLDAFSISQIAGAYCDDGQNYKNLVGFVKGLNMKYTETTMAGCPKPT